MIPDETEGTEVVAEVKDDKSTKEEASNTAAEETEELEEEVEENDEGAEETAEEPEKDEEEPKKPVSRAQERIRRQAEELKIERAQKETLIAERAQYATQLQLIRDQQYQAQSAEQRKAEEQRLSLLDPAERNQYESNKKINDLEYRLNQLTVQREDDRDRAVFHAKAAHDETYAKYVDQVEGMYQQGLSRGVRANREDLLAYQLGKELLKNKDSKGAEKKKAAAKRIESVTSTPTNAKGDVTGTRKGKSEEDRLRGVQI